MTDVAIESSSAPEAAVNGEAVAVAGDGTTQSVAEPTAENLANGRKPGAEAVIIDEVSENPIGNLKDGIVVDKNIVTPGEVAVADSDTVVQSTNESNIAKAAVNAGENEQTVSLNNTEASNINQINNFALS